MADSARPTDPAAAFSEAGVTRITRVTLHDAVLNQLRDMIVDGTLAPGARINEGQVCAALGVSRTPLREAIKTLSSEGLVEILPAKGAVVRRFSETDMREILDVLKILEQAAAVRLCDHGSDADIAAIVALHEEMMRLYAKRNRLPYFKLNQAIHSAIVKGSGNGVLAEAHGQLQSRIRRIRYVGNETPERWAAAVAEHEEMIMALKRRDGVALAEVLGRHLDKTIDRVRDAI